MNTNVITYQLEDSVITITIDDNKRNVVSPIMLKQLNAALDYAEKQNAVVVLTGKGDVFSAGFDLNILKKGVVDALSMISGGFKLSARLLAFPTPVIIACNGHAMQWVHLFCYLEIIELGPKETITLQPTKSL